MGGRIFLLILVFVFLGVLLFFRRFVVLFVVFCMLFCSFLAFEHVFLLSSEFLAFSLVVQGGVFSGFVGV